VTSSIPATAVEQQKFIEEFLLVKTYVEIPYENMSLEYILVV